jgi:malonyl-CoA O-methyltransferase
MLNPTDRKLRAANDAVAAQFNEVDFFCAEVRTRLAERLDLFRLAPSIILDLGASTGLATKRLKQRFPAAQVIELDLSLDMLRQPETMPRAAVCADAHQLPFADASIDMVFANLLLPGSQAPEQLFTEVRRVLKHPGLFLFSSLGPDTLKEVRRAWRVVDQFDHVHPFADMHNVGDALVKAGFADPVLDVEMLKINYRGVAQLVSDLRAVAATNHWPTRSRGLTSPRRWQHFTEALQRDSEGRIPVSFEIVCGQAWSGIPARGVKLEDGVASFPVSQLRRNQG